MTYRCDKCNAYYLLRCPDHSTLFLFPLPTHCGLASRPRSSKRARVFVPCISHAKAECHSLNIARDFQKKIHIMTGPRSKATVTWWCWLERRGYSKKLCLVVRGLSSAAVSSWHNKPHSLEREKRSSEDGSAAAYLSGSLETVAHAILSPCGLYLSGVFSGYSGLLPLN